MALSMFDGSAGAAEEVDVPDDIEVGVRIAEDRVLLYPGCSLV